MNRRDLDEQLTSTSQDLALALTSAHSLALEAKEAQAVVADRKAELKSAEAAARLTDLKGSNKEAREAEVYEMCTPAREAVQAAEAHAAGLEAKVSDAHLRVTIARHEHQLARDLLHLYTSEIHDT